ncbi:MAG: RHS repeat-associated core domain-containing protein [Candidatus Peribacteria bacterium]|nr:RHS repeat-associated core domain-containing protein [Candidatus Peribacteria bacterium]
MALYYFNARYYSPELGRFVSRDPIGIVDDINLYVYVGNNPLKFVDWSGLTKQLLADIENGNSFIVELVAR